MSNEPYISGKTDAELISYALEMWANWIETRDVTQSAMDAACRGKKSTALNADQVSLVLRIRTLAQQHRADS